MGIGVFRSLSAVLLTAAAISLGGCRAAIKPVPAPLEGPEAFSRSGREPLIDRWWQSFGDERLDALMERALDENFTLKATYDRLLAAQASARAAGADLIPEVEMSSRVAENWRHDSVTQETVRTRNYSLGIGANYEVDLWGRVRSLRNAAILDVEASREDLRAAAVTLSGSVASTWFRLVEEESQLELLESQIATTSETLSLIEGRFARGLTDASDVLQQRQLLESRHEERERAWEQRRQLEITLATLMASAPPPENFHFAASGLTTPPALPDTGVPASVVARRPDVRAAYLAVQAADQRVASALANRFPRLSLSASWDYGSTEWRDLFDNWVATIAGNVVAPVLDGGARRAEVDRRNALLRESFHRYADVYLSALAEVESALIAEVQRGRMLARIDSQLTLAREVRQRITTRYLNGTAEYLRVLDAQQSVHSLERRYLLAKLELILARVDLARALSGGWEAPAFDAPPVIAGSDFWPLPIPIHGDYE